VVGGDEGEAGVDGLDGGDDDVGEGAVFVGVVVEGAVGSAVA
jgi:hypothetical protein